MSIRILRLSHVSNYTPPTGYGGIELVVDILARYHARLGHRIRLIGVKPPGYEPIYEYISIFNEPVRGPGVSHKARYTYEMLKYSRDVDLLHSLVQWLLPPLILLRITGKPVIVTLHADPRNTLLFRYASRLGVKLVAISKTQKERLERRGIKIEDYVYLGIEVEKYPFSSNKEDYFLYLGRIDESKGVHIAIKSAKKTRSRLVIIGPITDIEYFNSYVKPHIDGELIVYLGEVDFNTKIEYLERARALLYPVQYEESFGLVMVEALATGTPLIGFARGSVTEIIRDEVTGLIVRDDEEMISAMRKVEKIDPHECRRDAEERFSADHMASRYVELYNRALRKTRDIR